jgi:hypothetical protein
MKSRRQVSARKKTRPVTATTPHSSIAPDRKPPETSNLEQAAVERLANIIVTLEQSQDTLNIGILRLQQIRDLVQAAKSTERKAASTLPYVQ